MHQLETFLKVIETRSFTGAARLLGITQPAVSQTIARLEEIFGGDLFVRGRGKLELTPIGRSIQPYAIDLLATVDIQLRSAIDTAQSRSGSLTIGFATGLAAGRLRDGLKQFAHANPDIHVRLIEGMQGELHRQLNDRTIDLMIAAFMPQGLSPTLERAVLWEERLLVALAADHPLARRYQLGWADIATLHLLLRTWQGENSPYQVLLTRMGGRRLDCEQHAVSRGALLAMVGMGLGATIISESARIPYADVVFLPIRGRDASTAVEAFWSANDGNPLRHRLLACLREAAVLPASAPLNAPGSATAPAGGPGSKAPGPAHPDGS